MLSVLYFHSGRFQFLLENILAQLFIFPGHFSSIYNKSKSIETHLWDWLARKKNMKRSQHCVSSSCNVIFPGSFVSVNIPRTFDKGCGTFSLGPSWDQTQPEELILSVWSVGVGGKWQIIASSRCLEKELYDFWGKIVDGLYSIFLLPVSLPLI